MYNLLVANVNPRLRPYIKANVQRMILHKRSCNTYSRTNKRKGRATSIIGKVAHIMNISWRKFARDFVSVARLTMTGFEYEILLGPHQRFIS